MFKSIRIRWAGHMAGMGEKRNALVLLWESQKKDTIRKMKV
jgi:hypothetical protein